MRPCLWIRWVGSNNRCGLPCAPNSMYCQAHTTPPTLETIPWIFGPNGVAPKEAPPLKPKPSEPKLNGKARR